MAHTWYVKLQTTVLGPLSSQDMRKLAQEGRVTAHDLVRSSDNEKWVRASSVKGLIIGAPQPSKEARAAEDQSRLPHLPSANFPLQRQWWVGVTGGQSSGPFGQSQLLTALSTGKLTAATLVCPVGESIWRPIALWPEFAAAAAGERPANLDASGHIPAESAHLAPNIRTLADNHSLFTVGMVLLIVTTSFGFARPLLFIPASAAQFWLDYKLATALDDKHPVRWSMATVVPVVGLFFLFLLSRRATKTLQAAGIKIGLSGSKQQD